MAVDEVPGAAALTRSLPMDRWAIVTSGTRAIAAARLAAAGITTPHVVVTAENVANGKPAPDPYMLAAARLQRPPAMCAVFEDAPAGVTAARRAGVRTVVGVGAALSGTCVSVVVDDLRGIVFDGTHLRIPE
ncbi:HAD-IA family hydrolase [Tsukamurella soli]|uniref:Haloacid dehalogenase superfamily, subfamily IA, variant 3 with third motif having DD or ED n=1 Tax=Tsukamurella soli TaxID=644556 RepID=A0ABP8J956_9ACTN